MDFEYRIEEGSYITQVEVDRLVESCSHDFKLQMLLEVLYYTGGRISEVVGTDGLIPARIFADKGYLILRNLKQKRKRNEWKEVHPPQKLLDKLEAWIKTNNMPREERIFKWSRWQVYYRLRKLSKIAGMEYVGRKFMHPHVFRHSFVMNAINKGVDMKYIQRETGHASIQMLGNYMSLRKEDIERNKKLMWS